MNVGGMAMIRFVALGVWQVLLLGSLLGSVAALHVVRKRLFVGILVVISLVLTAAVAYRYAADAMCWLSVGKSMMFYAGPRLSYHTVGSLERGDAVAIIGNRPGWLCIEHSVEHEEKRGWLPLTL